MRFSAVAIELVLVGLCAGWGLAQEGEPVSPEKVSDPNVGALADEVHDKGWIIYSAETDAGDWDLYLMRPDGSDRRNLTNTPAFNEAGAKFSPDGRKLLYYRMPKSTPVDNNKYGLYELVIANADGGNADVWGNGFQWASWGPEGKSLACLSIKGIDIVDVSSRKVTRSLARKGIVQQLVWSPDGKWFIGTANGLGVAWAIGRLNAESVQINAVSETDRYNCTPDWFPDGQRVVYSRGIVPGQMDWAQLWMADSEGGERRAVYAEEGRHIYGGCISPDARYILFTRSQQDLGEVDNSLTTMAIIRRQDTPTARGRNGARHKEYPNASTGPMLDLGRGWEPHWTYAEIGQQSSDPRVAELAQEVRRKGWIVYGARTAAGDWDLFLMRPDGTGVRNITDTPGFNEAAPRFSPDARRLLYRRLPRSENIEPNRYGMQGALVFANRDGSNPQVYGTEGEYTWASWGPQSDTIACMSRKGIYFVELATKKVLGTLGRKGFFQQVAWSPDGKWLCGVANSFGTGWSVARMNAVTGEVNAVSRVDNCTPDWFPDSQNLIFSYRPPNQVGSKDGWTQLWMADVEGRERRLVYGEDGRHVYGGVFSPDGRYVLFTGNMQEDGDPTRCGAPMGLMRLRDAPTIGGESRALRGIHGVTKDGPVLVLPDGWEPHWTYAEIKGRGNP
jgi:Tol biopolymer transport system component